MMMMINFSKKSQNLGTGAKSHPSLDLEWGTLLTFFSFLSLLPPNSGPSVDACCRRRRRTMGAASAAAEADDEMARRGASRPQTGTRVTSVGQSATWVAQQKNLKRIFDVKFITSTSERQALCKKLPPSFDNVSADESTNRELYQQWAGAFLPVLLLRQSVRGAICAGAVLCCVRPLCACVRVRVCACVCDRRALCLQLTSPHMVTGFLANEYQPDSGKGKDKFLKWQVAENYLSTLVLLFANKFKTHDDAKKYFFTCQNIKNATEPAHWLKGVKWNMKNIIFQRALESGEKVLDAAAPAVYPDQVYEMARQLAMEGSVDSIIVKFVTLTTMYNGGRPNETQFLSLNTMTDDAEFEVTQGERLQSKTLKVSLWSICAGENRHACWYVALGDYLASTTRQVLAEEFMEIEDDNKEIIEVPIPNEHPPLIPELQRFNDPGSWLGQQMKNMLPKDRGGSDK